MLADHFDIRKHIKFSYEVTKLEYLKNGFWSIEAKNLNSNNDIEYFEARHVVSANGPLSTPRMPELSGMESFQGESFHTAKWDNDINLKGKSVGIIGTGASAAQVITSIADEVKQLTVFQRTPTWAIEREDQPTPPEIVEAFKAGGYSTKLRHVDWKKELPPDPNILLLLNSFTIKNGMQMYVLFFLKELKMM